MAKRLTLIQPLLKFVGREPVRGVFVLHPAMQSLLVMGIRRVPQLEKKTGNLGLLLRSQTN